jgi:hypothetical protein
MTLGAVEKWLAGFDGWRTELADLPRSRRPRDTIKVEALCALIEGEGYLSQKKIAQILGVPHETIRRIWRDGRSMRNVRFNWVPHALDCSQKLFRSKFRTRYLIS